MNLNLKFCNLSLSKFDSNLKVRKFFVFLIEGKSSELSIIF